MVSRNWLLNLGLLLAALALASLSAGCVRYQSLDGVKNTWREVSVEQFQRGTTTQAEVLDWLGPPSQVIALGEQSVFYYLTEHKSGSGNILIVWNQAKEKTVYDRAIFFFDASGVLEEFSFSDETVDTR